MTRYIDADALEPLFYEHLDDNAMVGAMNAIEDAPTIDVVEVVRCFDCKYRGIKDFVYGYCKKKVVGEIKPNDFCSYGERRKL